MLNQAINDYKKTAEQVASILEPKRAALHEVATATRDQLAEKISDNAQRTALAEIIEQAISGADESARTSAPMVVQQFVTSQIKNHEVLAGNGRIVLEVFYDAAKGMPEQTVQQALEAILLAATGAVTAGLYSWPKPWHSQLSVDVVAKFASILDEAAHHQYADRMAALRTDHNTASRYAVEYADVVAITPTINGVA